MKKVKKEKSFLKKYWPVVVYLDDLREVVEVMKAICTSVELSSDDYIFESLDDAKEHFSNRIQTNFKISGSGPYSRVDYSRWETEVYVSSGDKSAQLFHELDEILIRQQRHLPFLYSYWIWIVSGLLGLFSFLFGQSMSDFASWIISGFSILVSLWFLYVMIVVTRRHSLIRFEQRSKTPTFFEQNKNAILMSILTGIISGGIGYGFAKLKDRTIFQPLATNTDKPK